VSSVLRQRPLAWLVSGQAFPPVTRARGQDTDAPGLLCAGADLGVDTLLRAYRHGIFPWYGRGQPILWWSPDPRMVLDVAQFRLHPSLLKTLKKFSRLPTCQIRVDTAFAEVMTACANSPRQGQFDTWILPEMIEAYIALHRAGYAHSVETWIDGQLAGGLYCVGIGRAVFGESMFHHVTDGSKIALAALICLCRQCHVLRVDCQQNTRHLQSMGACEVSRASFVGQLPGLVQQTPPVWQFGPEYWGHLWRVD